MPPKERKNRYKIKCLECGVEMDFDHKKKHNSRKHQNLLKQRKVIRYEVVGAPKNPFEAASRKALGVSTNVTTQTPETGTVETRHDEEFFSANSVRKLEKTATVNEENPEDIPQTTFQGPASSSVSDACDSALSMTMEKRAFDQIENEREVNNQEVKRQKMYEDSKIDVLVAPNFPHMSEDDLCSSSSDSSSNFQFDDPPQKMSPLVSLLNSDCKVLNFFCVVFLFEFFSLAETNMHIDISYVV